MVLKLLIGREFVAWLTERILESKERTVLVSHIAEVSGRTEMLLMALSMAAKHHRVLVVLNGAGTEAPRFNRIMKRALENTGVEVVLTERYHHVKVYVVDDTVVIGSHNLTGADALDVSVAVESKNLADELAEFVDELAEGGRPEIDTGVWVGDNYVRVFTGNIVPLLTAMVEDASEFIRIATFIASLSSETRPLYRLLFKRRLEGVDTLVVLNGYGRDSCKYNPETCLYLRSLGIRTCMTSQFLHSKIYAVDGVLLTGSHNLTSAGRAGRLELNVEVVSPGLASATAAFVDDIARKYCVEKCICPRRRKRGQR